MSVTDTVADRLAAALRAYMACDSQRLDVTNADRAQARAALALHRQHTEQPEQPEPAAVQPANKPGAPSLVPEAESLLRSTLAALRDLDAGYPWRELHIDLDALQKAGADLGIVLEDEPGTWAPPSPSVYTPATGSAIPASVHETESALLLVGDTDASEALIASWTEQQRNEAYDWAMAAHYAAIDNRVEVPPRPTFVPHAPKPASDAEAATAMGFTLAEAMNDNVVMSCAGAPVQVHPLLTEQEIAHDAALATAEATRQTDGHDATDPHDAALLIANEHAPTRELRDEVMGMDETARLIVQARHEYADEGAVEIDDDAATSISQDGRYAWVQAWVCVER